MNEWYYEQAGRCHGPITRDALRALLGECQLSYDTLVWTSDMGREWHAIRETGLVDAGPPPLPTSRDIGGAKLEKIALDEAAKIYGIYREYMVHESLLINVRMTWLLTINGFIFAGIGLGIQKHLELSAHRIDFSLLDNFLVLISFIGLLVSMLVYPSIMDAKKAAGALEVQFKECMSMTEKDGFSFLKLEQGGRLPGISAGGLKSGSKAGSQASKYIPLVFVLAYIFTIIGLLSGVIDRFAPKVPAVPANAVHALGP